MGTRIHIRVTDPAGNITIFVLDPFERADYARIAKALLALPDIAAEQVAFVTGPDSMEMCGLEFCGNASRSFALMCAEKDPSLIEGGRGIITVHVSGADEPLPVTVVPEIAYTKVRMPLHRQAAVLPNLGGTLVDFGGIVHLIMEDREASDKAFALLKNAIAAELDPPAIGVMFCNGPEMTPIVYVKDVDTVYYEGSCGSGTTAYAIAHSLGREDGKYYFEVKQPAGSLVASTEVQNGEVTRVWIEGEVRLSDPMTVEIP